MFGHLPVVGLGRVGVEPLDGTVGANRGQDIFSLGKGFVAFGANLQIPSGSPRAAVVQSADPPNRDYRAIGRWLDWTRHGSVAFKGKMIA